MTSIEAARTTTRRIPRVVVISTRGIRAILVAVIAAIAKPLGYRLIRVQHRDALGVADGAVPIGTTVFDDEIPGVANLDPTLLGALRQAAKAAEDDDVEFIVNSGWRSPGYQEQLLREAISKYGSAAEAARWVATAETSPHVKGEAVDIGRSARAWLSEHGAEYGLCQIYRNEPWHYELRPDAIEHGCPPMYADPSQDPRMRRGPDRHRQRS
jgi:hypothetical protein